MVLWAFKEFLPDWKEYFSILNKFKYIVLLGYINFQVKKISPVAQYTSKPSCDTNNN